MEGLHHRLLFLPLAIYYADVPVIYLEHKRMCEAEGGLRVFIEPEQVNRLVLDPDSFEESSAKYLLKRFYPKLGTVEAAKEVRTRGGNAQYFSYAVDPASVGKNVKNIKFIETPIASLSTDAYVLSSVTPKPINKHAASWAYELKQNERLYARWSMVRHAVTTIPIINGGEVWDCPDRYSDPAFVNGDELLVGLLLR